LKIKFSNICQHHNSHKNIDPPKSKISIGQKLDGFFFKILGMGSTKLQRSNYF
jgi:hypothetical protein